MATSTDLTTWHRVGSRNREPDGHFEFHIVEQIGVRRVGDTLVAR